MPTGVNEAGAGTPSPRAPTAAAEVADADDAVSVVTGATSGIGLATARNLAALGHRLVIVGRDPARGARAMGSLRPVARRSVDWEEADLSLLAEVRALARRIAARYARLRLLINNAGAIFEHRELTAEGLERTLALNVVSPFLLTSLLLPSLRTSAPSRIVNVASEAHRRTQMRWDDLAGERHYTGYGAYARSKLALVLWTYALARRLEGTGVTVNALHPGFVRTRWGRNNSGPLGWAIRAASAAAVPPDRGARTPTFVAVDPRLDGVNGRYFARERAVRSSRASYQVGDAERLWAFCEEATRSPAPGSTA